MNFSELKTEFFARGTDYLNEDAQGVARAERWLNQAYREILNLHAWPFLQAVGGSAEGAGSLSIPNLRKVLFVADVTTGTPRSLQRISLEDMVAEGLDPNTTGTPMYYWIEGIDNIRTYPSGGTLSVRYISRVDPLSGTDTPIFREEYHDLIVDRAMIKAYKDSDNFEAAAALKLEYDAGLAAMAEDYMLQAREVQFIVPPAPYDG